MKNPFEKNDPKVLIAGIIIGTAVAGAVAYLFLTEKGAQLLEKLTGHINRITNAVVDNQPSGPQEDQSGDYLQHRHKGPKTDRAALQHRHHLSGNVHQEPEQPNA